MQIGRRKIEEGQGVLDLDLDAERDPVKAVVQSQSSRLLVEVIEAAWRELGFDVISDEAFFQLVLARVVEPTSMSDAVRVLADLGLAPAHRNTFTATLRRCGKRGYRDQVATACFNHAVTSGDVSLVLYDVTTLYFEAENEDDAAQGRLLQGAPRRPPNRGRTAGRPPRVPARDRLLRGQQGRDRHHRPDRQGLPEAPQPGRHGRGRGRRDAVGAQPARPRRGRAAVHRRLPGDQGADGSGVPLPLARRRVHRRARSSTPSPRRTAGPSRTTPRSRPNRSGTPSTIQSRGGRCGPTRPNARSATTRPSRCRRTGPVRSWPARRPQGPPRFVKTTNGVTQPGRDVPGAGTAAGRVEGLRHQHPRRPHAAPAR